MTARAMAPVVLIVFNRPDLTSAAVARLARVAPPHVMVVADGPRDAAERDRCEQTLAAVRTGITWDCRVQWCVSETNLGCSQRVQTGLDWVFSHVGEAIILEDDIEVSDQFFGYATDALCRWRDDAGVGAITARNELIVHGDAGGDVLTFRSNVWGWATWADRWQDYRRGFEEEFDQLDAWLPRDHAPLLSRIHSHMRGRREWESSGVWDIAWALWLMTHDLRTVTPPVNMSVNHGFRPDGTHTNVALDLRGDYPIVDPALAQTQALDLGDRDAAEVYDEAVSLLDLMMLYAQPRRWRVMADHAQRTGQAPDGALDLMLEPWRRRDEAAAALTHLRRYVASPHLDELRAAFA